MKFEDHPLKLLIGYKTSQALNAHFEPFINERTTTGRLIRRDQISSEIKKTPKRNFLSRNVSIRFVLISIGTGMLELDR